MNAGYVHKKAVPEAYHSLVVLHAYTAQVASDSGILHDGKVGAWRHCMVNAEQCSLSSQCVNG